MATLIKEALWRSTPAVHTNEDALHDNMMPTRTDDLADVLEPIQTRKLRARLKSKSRAEAFYECVLSVQWLIERKNASLFPID